MSKVIESPVKRWPGSIVLPDYLTYPQSSAFRKAYQDGKALGENAPIDEFYHAILPGACACVESWNIQGLPEHVTAENFPFTPALASAKLASWIIGEVARLFAEAEEIPNA